jgi:hypothetical protein
LLSTTAAVNVTMKGDPIPLPGLPIEACTAAQHMGFIVCFGPIIRE